MDAAQAPTSSATRFRAMSPDDQIASFKTRWNVAGALVERLLEIAPEELQGEELYPTVPYTINGIVDGLFAVTTRELTIEHTSLAGELLSQASR